MLEQEKIPSLKKEASLQALEFVQDGMTLGLGSGSTVKFFIEALGERVQKGLKITGVPTSNETARLASELGIPLLELSAKRKLDLTIDGADQVEVSTLNLIKGLGGALLREKLVAVHSSRMLVIVDESKLVDRLGGKCPVPVEVVPFAWQTTAERLEYLGAEPHLRLASDGQALITDGGHHILDCHFASIEDAKALAAQLKSVVGVIETGLFIGVASTIIAAKQDGIVRLDR
jgi:ribose 5-phosphate isomerase A